MVSEETLVERVRQKIPSSLATLGVGIGDDAAVLSTGGRTDWVITADQFLDNVHFLRKIHAPKVAGYKALARATSDLAAMGARPRCFFLTLGLPDSCTGAWFDQFLAGMSSAARGFGLVLAGGDTTKYPAVIASLTVLGEVSRRQAVLRSGARPGDFLCVSGRLGEAELGWRLLKKKLPGRKLSSNLLSKHLRPEPRLALGQWLASCRYATSMIDTSDGLSTDLGRLCRASRVGAKVWQAKLPIVKVPRNLQYPGMDPLELALHGGEDYELLFTVTRRRAGRLPREAGGVPVTIIGEITRGSKIVLVDASGRKSPLNPQGWDPFRRRA